MVVRKKLCKSFLRLRENPQNKIKILKFNKNKWSQFIFHEKRKKKFYKKYKPKDHNKYLVSEFPTRWFSYKNRFKTSITASKKFSLSYGIIDTKTFKKTLLNKKVKNNPKIFLSIFETRLDTILLRAKFCLSINSSKQLIAHNKVKVNELIVNSCSYILKPGDQISVTKEIKEIIKKNIALNFLNRNFWPLPPKYLVINFKTLKIIFCDIVHNDSLISTNFNFDLNLEKILQNYLKQH